MHMHGDGAPPMTRRIRPAAARHRAAVFALTLALGAAGCGSDSSVSVFLPPSTPTPSGQPTSPIATATPGRSETPTTRPTPTGTAAPTRTAANTATQAPTRTASVTATPSNTPPSVATRTATSTASPTRSLTATVPATNTAVPPTATSTAPPTLTATASASATPPTTATSTAAATITATPVVTATPIDTATAGPATATASASQTAAATETPTSTAVATTPAGVTATATPTATPTPTASPTPLASMCGNGVLEPGETCTSCPQDCVVRACTASLPTVPFSFNLRFSSSAPTSLSVLIGYNSARLSIPGSGTAGTVSGRVTAPPPAPFPFIRNDLNYGLRVVMSRTSPFQAGTFLTVTFDQCQGAPAPTAADLACTIEGCAGLGGEISGCSCAVNAP